MDQALWEQTVAFHGHSCPGLAMGFKACEAAIEKLALTRAGDEELLCITENDACGVDAIQFVLGCTVGKGNLILRQIGKQVYTFFNRATGEGVRLCLKPTDKTLSREERPAQMLATPGAEMFEFSAPRVQPPEKARLFKSMTCSSCGEQASENKMHLQDGQPVCLDCYGEDYSRGW